MLKKIAAALFILLIIQFFLYQKLYAGVLEENNISLSKIFTSPLVKQTQELSAEVYIQQYEIPTKVNEIQLEKNYPGAKVLTSPANGNTTIKFYNPESKSYKVEIYDLNQGLVASFVNVHSDNITIDKDILNAGAYIYKLAVESDIHCGTFMIR